MAASKNVKKTDGTQTIFGANHKVVGNIAAAKSAATGAPSLVAPPHASPQELTYEQFRTHAVIVDTELADLYEQRWTIFSRMETYIDSLRYAVRGDLDYHTVHNMGTREVLNLARDFVDANVSASPSAWILRDVPGILNDYDAARDALNVIAAREQPLRDDYNKNQWSRAFLVVGSGGGHVHSKMECSSCFSTTRFNWLPEYSGASEDTVVGDAGERCCSICFPSAPAEVLNRPTKIFSEDEKKKAVERAERAKAKIVRDQEKVAKAATPDGSELVVVTERGITPDYARNPGQPFERRERFKTERAATMWVVDKIVWANWQEKNGRGGMDETEHEAINAVCRSLAAKHGISEEAVREQIAAKVVAKEKRDR
jgi:hypothetical protein